MLPQAALGALAGTLVSLLYTIGPDKPADPVVSKEEAQAAKVATWRQCAASKRKGERCHPVAEKGKRK